MSPKKALMELSFDSKKATLNQFAFTNAFIMKVTPFTHDTFYKS